MFKKDTQDPKILVIRIFIFSALSKEISCSDPKSSPQKNKGPNLGHQLGPL
jgi:hypothetical protein